MSHNSGRVNGKEEWDILMTPAQISEYWQIR
jgi:hypothetical protein